jgi:hypothetical protein
MSRAVGTAHGSMPPQQPRGRCLVTSCWWATSCASNMASTAGRKVQSAHQIAACGDPEGLEISTFEY